MVDCIRLVRAGVVALALALIPFSALAQGFAAGAPPSPYAPLAAGEGTTLATDSDSGLFPITLPFAFRLLGRDYTQAWVSVNGALVFDAVDPVSGQPVVLPDANVALPHVARPHGLVAIAWDDWIATPGAPQPSRIAWTVRGTAPDRRVVIDWQNVQRGGFTGPQAPAYSFSIDLREQGSIELRYGPPTPLPPAGRVNATIGLENSNGSVGMDVPGCAAACDFPTSGITLVPVTAAELSASLTIAGASQGAPTVLVNLTNNGDTGATTKVRLFLSTDAVLDASDARLADLDATVPAHGTAAVTGSPPLPNGAAGSYRIIAVVDPDDAVPELDERNNTAVSDPVFVGVDLTLTATGQPYAVSGEGATFRLVMHDTGTRDADAVGVRLVASGGGLTTPLELWRGTPFTLHGYEDLTQVVTASIPATMAAGDYTVRAQIDFANAIAERDENNNQSAAMPLTVHGADLAVGSVQPGLLRVSAGGTLPVRFTLQNLGPARAVNFRARVCLSDNDSLTLADRCVDTVGPITLEGLETRAFSRTVTVPADVAPGSWYVGILVDAERALTEANRRNNAEVAQTPVAVGSPLADLSVLGVSGPARAAAGEAALFSADVLNDGAADAEADWVLVLSTNGTASLADLVLASGRVTLKAGAWQSLSLPVALPPTLAPGTYQAGFLLDTANAVPETEEANNRAISLAPTEIVASALRVTTPSLPDPVIGLSYAVQLAATGAAGPVTWEVAGGELPPGLALSAAGALTGNPTKVGRTVVVVRVKSGDTQALATFLVDVVASAPSLGILDLRLPTARIGVPYSQRIGAIGGTPPYAFSVVSGLLPGGLVLAKDGTVSGIATEAVVSKMKIAVEDAGGHHLETQVGMASVADGGLRLGAARPGEARTGQAYSTQILAEGGRAPYTVTVVEGALPPGLSVASPATGSTIVVSGTPTEPGTYPFTLEVRDAAGERDLAPIVVRVGAASLVIATTTLPDAARGEAYEALLDSNAAPPAVWTVIAGTLPPGLALAADGTLAGTVDADAPYGLHAFAVRVTDASGSEALAPFVIDLPAPPPPADTGGCATAGGPGVLVLLALLFARRRPVLVAAAIALVSASASATYRVTRTSAPFTPLTGANTVFDPAKDGATPLAADLTLPFTFRFYRQPFSGVSVSARGLLTFGARESSAANTLIPSTVQPSNFIAPWWDDLQLGSSTPGGPARVSWAIEGTAPNRRFVVEWKDMQQRGNGQFGLKVASYSFQVRLYEGSGAITMHYGGAPLAFAPPATMSASVGIEGPGGLDGIVTSDSGCTPGCTGTDFPADAIVKLEPLPDLAIGDVALPAAMPFDTDVNVTAQLQNSGVGDAAAAALGLFLVGPGGVRTRLATSAAVAVPGGNAAAVTVRLRIPAHDPARSPIDLTPGPQRIVVVADPDDTVLEYDEGNDESPVRLVRLVGNGPDLGIVRVLGQPTGAVGQKLPITRMIRNDGGVAATGEARYRLSANELVSSADRIIQTEPLQLAPGAVLSGNVDLAIPADVPPGRYWVGLEVTAPGELTPLDDLEVFGPVELRGGALAVTTEALPEVTAGAPFAVQLVATGGAGDLTWSFDGDAPRGVTLDASGVLGGVVDDVSEVPLRVRVESGSASASRAFTLRSTGGSAALEVASSRLPIGLTGSSYSASLVARGGKPPYSWAIAETSSLPLGLSLGANGDVEGVPLVDGLATFAVEVTDAAGATASGTVELAIAGGVRPMFATGELPPATRNTAFDARIAATGGTPPYQFTVLDTRRVPGLAGDAGDVFSGAAPPGLTLSEDGHLAGTPVKSGVYLVTVRLVDAAARDDLATLALSVEDVAGSPFSIATTSLPDAFTGRRYGAQLRTSGEDGAVTWSVVQVGGASLPETFSLRVDGALSFFPQETGTLAFLAVAQDEAGRMALRPLALRVQSPPEAPKSGCASTGAGALAVLGLAVLLRRRRGLVLALAVGVVAGCSAKSNPCGEACGAGLTCDAADGLCKCGGAGGAVCGAGETCDAASRTCLAPACATSCPAGTACGADGACHCGGPAGAACDAGETCNAFGRCETVDSCRGVVCTGGMVCDPGRHGECRCGVGGPACGAGETCARGVCESDPCSGVACTGGTQCDPADGLCKCGGTAGAICRLGEVCNGDGACVRSTTCAAVTCLSGEVCDPADGTCRCGRLNGPRCRDDQTCDPLKAACTGGDLCAEVRCAKGFSCDPEDGVCKCGGADGRACAAGEFCLASANGASQACAKGCTVLGPSACPEKTQCLYDEATGAQACGPEGIEPDETSCDEVVTCAAGLHCWRPNAESAGICRPYCRGPADCHGGLACRPLTDGLTLGVCVPVGG